MRFNLDAIFRFTDKLGGSGDKPPYQEYYIYVLLLFVAYLIADVGTFYSRGFMLPSGSVKSTQLVRQGGTQKKKAKSKFQAIKSKNIFNADHRIPKSLGEIDGPGIINKNEPVLTSLPLELVGTIVHKKGPRSVATIQVKGKKEIEPYKAGDVIKGFAKVDRIIREKVFIINSSNGRLEFIEIKDRDKIKMGFKDKSTALYSPSDDSDEIFKTFKRDYINKHLSNLSRVLQDAKAVEYTDPRTGEFAGFKLVAVKAGSVYEELGFQRNDVIKTVNGEPVDTAQKAMELYQQLKNSTNIEIGIERDGSSKTMSYTVE